MTSITGYGYGAALMHSRTRIPSDQATQMAQNLFARLDTQGQGYLTQADLQSAMNSASTTSAVNSTTNVDKLFSKLDGNRDGKVTETEFTQTLTSMAEQVASQGSVRAMRGGPKGPAGMPPPPPPSGEDPGQAKDELQAMLDETGTTDTKLAGLIKTAISNFDAADSDGDGEVTFGEAIDYDRSVAQSSGAGTEAAAPAAAGSNPDRAFLSQISRLMQAYAIAPQGATSISLDA